MSSIKSLVRLGISAGLHYSGGAALYSSLNSPPADRRKIRILSYHDIADNSYLNLQVPPAVFDSHVKYLVDKRYNIISLNEAARLLASNDPIPPNSVVITFDDGYRSIYTKVFPVVKKYGIPITVFVSTGPVDLRCALFVDSVVYLLNHSSKKRLDLTFKGLASYSLSSTEMKERACVEIVEFGKNLVGADRKVLLREISEKLDIPIDTVDVREMMLTAEEIREMSRHGVDFGAHTVTHPSLSRVPSSEAELEILASKKRVEEITGKEVTSFAYPYGSTKDVNKSVRNLVEKHGFKCACVLQDGLNAKGDDLFLLKRTNITNHIKEDALRFLSRADFAVQMSNVLTKIKEGPEDGTTADEKPGTNGARKINILFLIDQLSGMAGTERHLLYLASHLDPARFNCHIGTFDGKEGVMLKAIEKIGTPFTNLNLTRIYSPKAPFSALKLSRIIKEKKIDIVQTFHFMSDTYGVMVSRLSGVPKIISSKRDMGDLKTPRQTALSKVMNRYVDRYIMVCDNVGKRFNAAEGIPADKMQTIYNGVDLERFDPKKSTVKKRSELGLKRTDFVVGTTAIFRPEKAHHILFEAIEKVLPQIPNLKVVLIGFGPTQQKYVDYCANGPLKEVVKFLGLVGDVENYVPLMDVFCLVPNKNEGFSNAIIEAMAMGRPIIASDVGGNAEAVLHEKTGYIIPPDNSELLSEYLLDLYNDPIKRRRMGKKARERAEETFSLQAMIKNHADYYEKIFKES